MLSNLKVEVNLVKNPATSLIAMASVIVDGAMKIGGFKVFNGRNGLFVGVPSHKGKDKEDGSPNWQDDVIFLDEKAAETDRQTPTQKQVCDAVLNEYKRISSGTGTRGGAAAAQNGNAPRSTGQRPANPDDDYQW
jgi:DNA-binding cell septation regulator SpoVG